MTNTLRSALVVTCLFAANAIAQDADKPPDERGLTRLKRFMEILTTSPDIDTAAKTVVSEKLVHAGRIDKNNPRTLNNDALRFSFKKAFDNAKLYDPAPLITRYQLTTTSAVGFGPTAMKGKLWKYFVAKKEGVNGMPAPIQIFYPEDGSEPLVYDFGSF
jgi:hypothetical protein